MFKRIASALLMALLLVSTLTVPAQAEYCTQCGVSQPEGARFCFMCGSGLFGAETEEPEDDHTPLFCILCGVEQPFGVEWCINCGELLESMEESEPTPVYTLQPSERDLAPIRVGEHSEESYELFKLLRQLAYFPADEPYNLFAGWKAEYHDTLMLFCDDHGVVMSEVQRVEQYVSQALYEHLMNGGDDWTNKPTPVPLEQATSRFVLATPTPAPQEQATSRFVLATPTPAPQEQATSRFVLATPTPAPQEQATSRFVLQETPTPAPTATPTPTPRSTATPTPTPKPTATPKPTSAVTITSMTENGKGQVIVRWTDAAYNGPYDVCYLRRVSSSFEDDMDASPFYWRAASDVAGTSITLENLCPGVDYWIAIYDADDRQTLSWYNAKPATEFPDYDTKVNFMLRKRNSNNKTTELNAISASDYARNHETMSYGGRLELDPPQLARARSYNAAIVMTDPRGEVIVEYTFNLNYSAGQSLYYWTFYDIDSYLKVIYDAYEELPVGAYKLDVYYDGQWAGGTTYQVVE